MFKTELMIRVVSDIINALKTSPHMWLYGRCDDDVRALISEDITAFLTYGEPASLNLKGGNALRYFLLQYPEFRNVYYYRVSKTSKRFHLGAILKLLLPPLDSLMFGIVGECGGGIYIQHGFSTVIHARSIGKNVFINQQVTIGAGKTPEAIPVIGDNVKIHAGAIVIGDIKVGDNVTIGAGSVVYKNVPDNSTVVCARSRILCNGKETIM